MTIAQLTNKVRDHFGVADVRYVLNWGGFENASFTILEGAQKFHLKLARAGEDQEALRRWLSVHRHLEDHYHAPRVKRWIEINGTDRAGLLFDHVEGRPLDLRTDVTVFDEIVRTIGSLHRDSTLAEHLGAGARQTHLDCFLSRYVSMLDEDLNTIRNNRPPFVSEETFDWMTRELRRVEKLGVESDAFGADAVTPAHWDLWANNILVTPDERWFLLDWDSLALGDPAMDYSTLAFPVAIESDWRDLPIRSDDPGFAPRMDLYLRVQALDWVIDVLADWVDCAIVPEVMDSVRARKRDDHLHYLALYRRIFG